MEWIWKNSTQLRELFYCKFWTRSKHAYWNFGKCDYEFFLFFSNWSICERQESTMPKNNAIYGMRGMRSNAVVFFPLLEERSVLQLHRISLRATWYQARFYASIVEKYLISAEIYRHEERATSREAKKSSIKIESSIDFKILQEKYKIFQFL